VASLTSRPWQQPLLPIEWGGFQSQTGHSGEERNSMTLAPAENRDMIPWLSGPWPNLHADWAIPAHKFEYILNLKSICLSPSVHLRETGLVYSTNEFFFSERPTFTLVQNRQNCFSIFNVHYVRQQTERWKVLEWVVGDNPRIYYSANNSFVHDMWFVSDVP